MNIKIELASGTVINVELNKAQYKDLQSSVFHGRAHQINDTLMINGEYIAYIKDETKEVAEFKEMMSDVM